MSDANLNGLVPDELVAEAVARALRDELSWWKVLSPAVVIEPGTRSVDSEVSLWRYKFEQKFKLLLLVEDEVSFRQDISSIGPAHGNTPREAFAKRQGSVFRLHSIKWIHPILLEDK